MNFCWFLTCCLAARQDECKKIKRHVKKYGLVELKKELESLGVNIHEHVDDTKKKNIKKTKKKLQKLLIKELKKKIEHSKNGLDNRTFEDELPDHVQSALNELESGTLRVNTDDDAGEIKRKYKRKSELQRFLINELREVEPRKTELDNKGYEEECTMPMEIPEVLNVLDDLDTFLDKELEVGLWVSSLASPEPT